jgi:hypothetical protein
MTSGEPRDDDEREAEAELRSDAMSDQLRNDVSSWKAARSEELHRGIPQAAPVTKPAPKPAARPRAAKPAAAAALPADEKKKPFGMSYDGMTQADYITYRISRGAR